MAKPYSDDLRERAVAAIESGHTREEVAELYNLALSTVGGFIRRKRETGSVSPANLVATRHLRLHRTLIWSRSS
jgi:transposase